MNATILIVEDDDNLRLTLSDFLELEDFAVKEAATIGQADSILQASEIDLIILDIMLPDGDGYEYAKRIRERNSQVMILMLTARELERDVIEGFESGADEYVTKPYRTSELLLRIKALLRRKSLVQETTINQVVINGFCFDWQAMQVMENDNVIALSSKALLLMRFFFERINKVQSRDEILSEVWGEDVYVDNRTVDNFVSNLKKKFNLVERQEFFIKSVRGVGYCLMRQKV